MVRAGKDAMFVIAMESTLIEFRMLTMLIVVKNVILSFKSSNQ